MRKLIKSNNKLGEKVERFRQRQDEQKVSSRTPKMLPQTDLSNKCVVKKRPLERSEIVQVNWRVLLMTRFQSAFVCWACVCCDRAVEMDCKYVSRRERL